VLRFYVIDAMISGQIGTLSAQNDCKTEDLLDTETVCSWFSLFL